MSESVNFNLVVQINAIKTCRNLGSSHTTGERYSTWQKWNVDPTSLSDPSHSCICELDEGWGTPADDVKVPELSIPVAPKHSELQTVDWKNTKKHFIISSFTGINHHIYCSFWRKGDECRYILSTTSFFVTFYLESSKDEDPSLIGFSMSSSKNLYSLCGSRLSDTTVKKVPQSFIVSLVMFSREVLKIGITQSHRALTYSRKSLEINKVLQ